MFTAKNYVAPTTLEEAYTVLMQNKKNQVLGGMMWMRLGQKNIPTVIDLKKLGLNNIVETEDGIEIGASVTLRQMETHPLLETLGGGILAQCVKHIVGVQFRNSATIGGSVFGKFGFSNIITALLALETEVVLYHGGRMPLEQFLKQPFEKDILTHLCIKKDSRQGSYHMYAQTATDLPVIVVATSRIEDTWRIAVGARPAKAKLSLEASRCLASGCDNSAIEAAAEAVIKELGFGTNLRASQTYRELLAKELVIRSIKDLCVKGE
ncbi:MAG: FAD binding domain-containing protein [Cellulosilyticaceae bacterium]